MKQSNYGFAKLLGSCCVHLQGILSTRWAEDSCSLAGLHGSPSSNSGWGEKQGEMFVPLPAARAAHLHLPGHVSKAESHQWKFFHWNRGALCSRLYLCLYWGRSPPFTRQVLKTRVYERQKSALQWGAQPAQRRTEWPPLRSGRPAMPGSPPQPRLRSPPFSSAHRKRSCGHRRLRAGRTARRVRSEERRDGRAAHGSSPRKVIGPEPRAGTASRARCCGPVGGRGLPEPLGIGPSRRPRGRPGRSGLPLGSSATTDRRRIPWREAPPRRESRGHRRAPLRGGPELRTPHRGAKVTRPARRPDPAKERHRAAPRCAAPHLPRASTRPRPWCARRFFDPATSAITDGAEPAPSGRALPPRPREAAAAAPRAALTAPPRAVLRGPRSRAPCPHCGAGCVSAAFPAASNATPPVCVWQPLSVWLTASVRVTDSRCRAWPYGCVRPPGTAAHVPFPPRGEQSLQARMRCALRCGRAFRAESR